MPKSGDIKEEQLIAAFLPQGVVCVESALFHYGYSDFASREWSIAIPRSFSRTIMQMQKMPVKAYYIQEKYCDLGRTTDQFNGVMLTVYDLERIICDCFKYRTKLDNELYNKALKAYVCDDKKNLSNLSKYARKMRVYTKLMSVMEVLLFDEPTSGLDYHHMIEVAEMLRALTDMGKTVFVITHDSELIWESCRYFLFIDHGTVSWNGGWTPDTLHRLADFLPLEFITEFRKTGYGSEISALTGTGFHIRSFSPLRSCRVERYYLHHEIFKRQTKIKIGSKERRDEIYD